jgi:hypothetical protein
MCELLCCVVARSIYSSGHQLKLADVVHLQHRFAEVHRALQMCAHVVTSGVCVCVCAQYYRAHATEPEVQALVERVGKFSDAIDELGLKEYHFDEEMRVPVIMKLVIERVVRLCLIMPFALSGWASVCGCDVLVVGSSVCLVLWESAI